MGGLRLGWENWDQMKMEDLWAGNSQLLWIYNKHILGCAVRVQGGGPNMPGRLPLPFFSPLFELCQKQTFLWTWIFYLQVTEMLLIFLGLLSSVECDGYVSSKQVKVKHSDIKDFPNMPVIHVPQSDKLPPLVSHFTWPFWHQVGKGREVGWPAVVLDFQHLSWWRAKCIAVSL